MTLAMPSIADQHHLKTLQYKDAANLTARSSLHERFSTKQTGWFAWVFEQLASLPEQSRILELGCGPAGVGWRAFGQGGRIPERPARGGFRHGRFVQPDCSGDGGRQ